MRQSGWNRFEAQKIVTADAIKIQRGKTLADYQKKVVELKRDIASLADAQKGLEDSIAKEKLSLTVNMENALAEALKKKVASEKVLSDAEALKDKMGNEIASNLDSLEAESKKLADRQEYVVRKSIENDEVRAELKAEAEKLAQGFKDLAKAKRDAAELISSSRKDAGIAETEIAKAERSIEALDAARNKYKDDVKVLHKAKGEIESLRQRASSDRNGAEAIMKKAKTIQLRCAAEEKKYLQLQSDMKETRSLYKKRLVDIQNRERQVVISERVIEKRRREIEERARKVKELEIAINKEEH